ncbi:hypothetical protein B0H11DRAFT_2005139, partial [Mycena galericulata]
MASHFTTTTRAADRARIAELDSEITALEHVLRKLHKQRKRVQTRLDAYKYPVLTLPNEIVSEIFNHFLPEYPLCAPAIGLLSPTQLTHICRQWRDIALSTPTLWRAISMSLHGNHTVSSQVLLLETWLARSRSSPVSIEMMGICDVDESAVESLIQGIVSCCNRWEQLGVITPPKFFSSFKGTMPFLRDLRIGMAQIGLPAANTWVNTPILVFQDAPLLRKLTLLTYIPPNLILPWAQLTHFIARGIHHIRCWVLLEHMPNLVYCRLGLLHLNHGLPPNGPVVPSGPSIRGPDRHLVYLETFASVTLNPRQSSIALLSSFTFPALRKLRVSEDFISPDPINTLVAFVSRSGCNLQELCITGGNTSVDEYRKVLPSIPSLVVERQKRSLDSASNRIEEAEDAEMDSDIDTGSDDDE